MTVIDALPPAAEASIRFLRLAAVRELTGLSRSAIYALPGFPKAVPIGERAVAWREDEVRAWMRARIEERDAA